jgi:hypothetical protein
MGMIAFRARDLTTAAKYLGAALEMEEALPAPLKRQTLQYLGMAEFDLGNPSKASMAFEQWAAVEPESPLPPLQLARVAARQGEEASCRQALELAILNAQSSDGRTRSEWLSAVGKLMAVDPELRRFAAEAWFQVLLKKTGFKPEEVQLGDVPSEGNKP